LIPPARATSGAWHVTPGIARWSKRRRHSLLQSVGALRGQPGAAWHERPPVRPQGAILADSSWRAAVERTSVSGGRPALRGTRRNRRPQRLAHRVRAVRHTRFEREMRKGLPSSLRARTGDKGVRGRFEEGICALKGPQTFARVGRSTEPVRPRTHVDHVARRSRFSARGGRERT